MIAVDTTLVVALVSALATPMLTFVGIVYVQRRQANLALQAEASAVEASRFANRSQEIAAASEAEARRVTTAMDTIVRALAEQRIEMDRQDIEHARQLADLRSEHERQVKFWRVELRGTNERLAKCHEVRAAQERELARLRGR